MIRPKVCERRLKKHPSDTFLVYNDTTHKWEGVAGVKIRITNLLKWTTTYTNADGYYRTSKYFRVKKVHYAMIFENAQGFNIGSWCVIAKARIYELGWHSSHGYKYTINTNSSRWSHCVVNNSAYYMYQHYKNYIPSNMVLWVWEKTGTGCAAMLHHYTAKNWKQLIEFVTAGLINIALFNHFAPDIIVGAKGKGYYGLCETTCHELAHAIHFKKVGKDYWDKYINGIIACTHKSKNDIYGTSSTTHPYSGYIGVGETFGYAMGYYMANQKCGKKSTPPYYWFKPIISYNLLNEKTLTPLQFLDCMDRNTTDLTKLGINLHAKKSTIPSNCYAQ